MSPLPSPSPTYEEGNRLTTAQEIIGNAKCNTHTNAKVNCPKNVSLPSSHEKQIPSLALLQCTRRIHTSYIQQLCEAMEDGSVFQQQSMTSRLACGAARSGTQAINQKVYFDYLTFGCELRQSLNLIGI